MRSSTNTNAHIILKHIPTKNSVMEFHMTYPYMIHTCISTTYRTQQVHCTVRCVYLIQPVNLFPQLAPLATQKNVRILTCERKGPGPSLDLSKSPHWGTLQIDPHLTAIVIASAPDTMMWACQAKPYSEIPASRSLRRSYGFPGRLVTQVSHDSQAPTEKVPHGTTNTQHPQHCAAPISLRVRSMCAARHLRSDSSSSKVCSKICRTTWALQWPHPPSTHPPD